MLYTSSILVLFLINFKLYNNISLWHYWQLALTKDWLLKDTSSQQMMLKDRRENIQ